MISFREKQKGEDEVKRKTDRKWYWHTHTHGHGHIQPFSATSEVRLCSCVYTAHFDAYYENKKEEEKKIY